MPEQVDPQVNLQHYIDQWKQANAQYNTDYAYLYTMIKQMLALAKEGGNGIEEAFQVAEMGVMPSAMQVQGDVMGQLAGSMNIASALEQFTTDAQNEMNKGGKITENEAAKFVYYIQEFYLEIKHEMGLPKDKQWMDPNTAKNLMDAITKISNQFGAKTPMDWAFNGGTV